MRPTKRPPPLRPPPRIAPRWCWPSATA
ncbi:unnamed protein product [Linum tenue]|uniref:Uncharacterized protein n=1 Tax=Linum tenue TaxID=586396 RepID=A0AAV0S5I1_9ROSI|nr:unnamed protein product [Linum tenue]